jgi:cyclopropane-fatty-acyl-phospholipid synthase
VQSLPRGGAAAAIAPLLSHFFGGPPPVRVRVWDGTSLGPAEGDTLQVCSPDAVRRMLWSPSELGLARSFVEGDLAFEGDISEMLAVLRAASPPRVRTGSRLTRPAVRAAHRLGSSADRSVPHWRRWPRGAGCTHAPATHRLCDTTTT